jgi:branched-chain amino acid transport system ATP-binding protein
MSPMLEALGVSKNYGDRPVVDHVHLVAEAGRIAVIIGPNGAGKTTLFNCLSGVEPLDAGTVWHRGHDVTGWSSDALARRGLARTFQRSSIFPTLSVTDNLRVAAENHRNHGVLRGLAGLPDRNAPRAGAVVREVLADLGLTAVADVRAGVLPSGTLRLVELGRALCGGPDTLLLDEPASGLDGSETEELHKLLHRLAARNLALVMVEHDLELVHQAADIVYVMISGRFVAAGPPAEMLARPDVRLLLFGRTAS